MRVSSSSKQNQRLIAAEKAKQYLSINKHLIKPSLCNTHSCVYNFSYGANINPYKLECKRGIKPMDGKLRGKLIDYQLLFNHKGGFGNIISKDEYLKNVNNINKIKPFVNNECNERYEVHGILIKLSCDDFIKLASIEHEYDLIQVPINVYNNDGITDMIINAIAFKSYSYYTVKKYDIIPTKRYMNLIRNGAKQMNIHQKYCTWLDGIDCISNNERGYDYYDLCVNN